MEALALHGGPKTKPPRGCRSAIASARRATSCAPSWSAAGATIPSPRPSRLSGATRSMMAPPKVWAHYFGTS